MPRTSYGDEKRKQSWDFVAILLNARGNSQTEKVALKGVEIEYKNWHDTRSSEQPYLCVKGTLSAFSKLSKTSLSAEQIRESINEHLGKKFIGILDDRRAQKAGRGAETWKFDIRLWSTEIIRNQQEFFALWEQKKGNEAPFSQQSQNPYQYDFSEANADRREEISVINLVNSLQPYEKLLDQVITSVGQKINAVPASQKLNTLAVRLKFLEIVLEVSSSQAVCLFTRDPQDEWQCKLSTESIKDSRYAGALSRTIFPALSDQQIFSKDSHGRIVKHDNTFYILIALKQLQNEVKGLPAFVCLCDVTEGSILSGEPFGEIVSTLFSLNEDSARNAYLVESMLLDALKRSFNFVSPKLYKRRFSMFKTRLETMTVNFQPIVKLNPLVLEAWEALARDPETLVGQDTSTMTAPVDLFEAAELWGIEFTTELDLYFLQTATRRYKELRDAEQLQRFHDTLPLSVNVYPSSLVRNVYLETVKEVTTTEGLIPAEKLILEISEKSSLPEASYWNSEPMSWQVFKRQLKKFVRESPGIRFAIDDFGVGHASVSRLVELNLEYVKIDREILNYEEDVRDKVITFVLETLIESGHYSPHIIVEGVDKDYPISLNDLLAIGAQSIQGYIVDKPRDQIYERLGDEQFAKLKDQLSVVA